MTRLEVDASRLPTLGAGFVWGATASDDGEHPVVLARCPGVAAAFTTRRGGCAPPPWDSLHVAWHAPGRRDGDPALTEQMVRTNRAIASRAIGAGAAWSTVREVHGARVVPAPDPGVHPEADAMWTDDAARTLAITGADCVPVLLHSAGRIAVAHAGWRGLAAGVLANAAQEIGAARAWVGPAVGPCCYEVGPEVAAAFDAGLVDERSHLDLWAASARALRAAGVGDVRVCGVCTSCHAGLFFSHRRDRGRTGRQALLARLA